MSSKPRNFSVWTLVTLVVGNAVGAGIYTTSGFSLADLGSREWVVVGWLAAGVIALAGALSYGMLVQRMTESGGEYLYLSKSIHPLAGFIAGWVSLLAGFPGAIAFAALAFEAYMRAAAPVLSMIPGDVLAVLVTAVAGLIHIVRVKAGAKTHEWIVVFMLGALSIIIIGSLFQFATSADLPVRSAAVRTNFNLLAFANTLVWISLSYSGFNAAAYVAGEVHDAKRLVPKGMIIGTLITMLLCVTLNTIMLYGAPPEVLSGQPDIAARAAESMGGSGARRLMEFVIAISLLTSITAMVLAGPRVYAKMAEDGALPRWFAMRAGQPPRTSIALQVFAAIMLILIADLRSLLSYLGFTLSLCLALAVSSLFVWHWRHGERPVSIWYPFAPALFVICTMVFAVLSAFNEPKQFYAAIPTAVMGVVAFAVSKLVSTRLNERR